MPSAEVTSEHPPDYTALVRHLIEPLLSDPTTLKVSCELSRGKERALIRVAFDTAEHGRVLGRGGRNIEAIRTVLQASAQGVDQSARLEVFDARQPEVGQDQRGRGDRRRSQRARPTKPPAPRKRLT